MAHSAKSHVWLWIAIIVIIVIPGGLAIIGYFAYKNLSFGKISYGNINWQSVLNSFISGGQQSAQIDVTIPVDNKNDFPIKATDLYAELHGKYDGILVAKSSQPISVTIPANTTNFGIVVKADIFLNPTAIKAATDLLAQKDSGLTYSVKMKFWGLIPFSYSDNV